MRRFGLVLAAMLLLTGTQAQAQTAPPYPWNARIESAGDYARSRSGRFAFAVVDPRGRVRGRKVHARYRSASLVKAMLLVAYLNQRGVRGRPLRRADKALLRPMIVRSGNREATAVRNIVGNGSLGRLARRARMKDFATGPSWGSTQVSAYDQARFFRRIDAYVPLRHRTYARSLLGGIVTRHRWGIPPAVPEGWAVFFKGGWHQPHRANQAALLQRGRDRIAIAVLTDGNPSFRYGRQTIEGVSRRLLLRVNEFTP